MNQILENDWEPVLKKQFQESYYQHLREFLKQEYQSGSIYPDKYDIFNALHLTPFHKVKAVILGQDPYHGQGQAHGLSFSVKPGTGKPPSLRNIFIEMKEDLGCDEPNHGSLVKWAKEGVLLLNTVLTVRKGEANSHKGKGWEQFTDEVIKGLNSREKPVVFILWGKHAQAKKEIIDTGKHFIIESPHPSPFSASRGFFGSKPFSKANGYLKRAGEDEIDWCISDEDASL
ncbi:uracil-DNA glycosylase [Metabacillus sp. GX 13764]|uniref:uracil-DNA glycosylase n=1 Tax=Metabacillus kandeliae TaxID=2900151 RepID=UPI001E511122|nr:uracil-DNA glycosylase [Metabacillus kandeliae]MCD7034744.1 uracil-DNA glycosylase [Metabacillus kandeliae]